MGIFASLKRLVTSKKGSKKPQADGQCVHLKADSRIEDDYSTTHYCQNPACRNPLYVFRIWAHETGYRVPSLRFAQSRGGEYSSNTFLALDHSNAVGREYFRLRKGKGNLRCVDEMDTGGHVGMCVQVLKVGQERVSIECIQCASEHVFGLFLAREESGKHMVFLSAVEEDAEKMGGKY